MSDHEPPSFDDLYTSLMAAYDEALAGRASSDRPEAQAPDDPRGQLEGDLACLRLLRERWPQPAPAPANGASDPAATVGLLVPTAAPTPSLTRLGRFEVRRELGRGTFGQVFLAYDPQLGREVAMKVPRAEALDSPELRTRFQREARAAAGLDHPGVVQVYEAGEVDGLAYIASAYCPGPTLAAWLKDRAEPVPPRLAAQLVAALADAVQHAHSRGVLHRDLKPANVLLVGSGEWGVGSETSGSRPPLPTPHSPLPIPKITDFGLAKLLEAGPAIGEATPSGAILGTPLYMAPEQASWQSNRVGPAADLYALGAILYELLTGRPPFQGETVLDLLDQVRGQEPVPPSRLRPKLPRDVQTICLKCLNKEPERRYASATALAEDLRRFLNGEPIRARPAGAGEKAVKWVRRRPAVAALIAMSGLAALALVVGGVAWWYNGRLSAAFGEAERLRQRAIAFETAVRYTHDMNTAQRAWETADIVGMNRLLDAWEPGANQPHDLRGWEHFYLRNLGHRELRTLASVSPIDVAFSPDGRWLAAACWGKDPRDYWQLRRQFRLSM